ncbi:MULTISPECIES: hypothetical protein [unclassified Pseudactinotalea]|uniref:hypothetical protein n=1 Tax=unclassified Pseudactinotalea TaxID=2649176 RepID=UPI00128CE22A|nr:MULTISPECIES: hypothetical protein [unclassified Pseudactinotalea]MPV49352.1 hypothetical protein [Pseudactinotalea sp. HY160]QGH69354.1 hypothetical protein GCE65_07380 [Pseudactinotalea sp. HY158]
MRRLFWVAVGVGVTVVALRRLERASGFVRTLAPGNLADSIGRLAGSLTEATAEFRTAMAEEERRLTDTLLARSESAGESPGQSPGAGSRSRHRRPDARTDRDTWGLDSDDPDLYL